MEKINGISFEDWAAACAHLAQGMPEDKVIAILGIETPVWQDTNEQWGNKLGDLMVADISVATKYGNIFANPKIGKFGEGNTAVKGSDELLKLVPNWEAFQKIHTQISEAAQHGIDTFTVLEENGLDIGKWGSVSMKYMNQGLNSITDNDPDTKEKFDYYSGIIRKWQNHWKEHYKNHSVNLSDDIDF